jgi:hypothetical protein
MEDTEDLISVGDLAGHELRLHRMSGNDSQLTARSRYTWIGTISRLTQGPEVVPPMGIDPMSLLDIAGTCCASAGLALKMVKECLQEIGLTGMRASAMTWSTAPCAGNERQALQGYSDHTSWYGREGAHGGVPGFDF